MVPIKRVRAESFNQIELPTNLTVQLERRKGAALEVNEHALAVRGGRRVAAGAIAMLARPLRSERGLPERQARPIERQHGVEVVGRGGKINALVPDNRRRTALAGQGRLPKNLLEFHRITPAFNAAVVTRPAPAGPV